ncbi:MFS transporter [Clostridium sp.]|uniref:MFS transporter n=1 Tax=Clostridium sp. TaxID=1506 RepID=UPI002FCA353C
MITTKITFNKSYNKRETSNFILFSLGKLVSIFGNAIYTFAMGLFVLQSTGSGLSFATTLIVGTIPILLVNPIAGVMADRFDKKKLVIWTDIFSGLVLLAVYLLSLIYGLSLMMIYISTFIITSFTCIFGISIEAAKPNMVSDKMLLNINSVSKIIDSISSILGPMIGGMVFAFMDIKVFILINGLSYIMSGISEMFIDFKFNVQLDNKNNEESYVDKKLNYMINIFIKDIKDGFKYIIMRKGLTRIISIFVSLNFFLGLSITVPLPYIINNVLRLSSREFGFIEGAFPVGLIVGALLIKKIIENVSYNRLLVNSSKGIAVSMILMGLPVLFINTAFNSTVYLIYYCVTMILLGIFIAFVDIPLMYILQKFIPNEYRGRVISLGITIAKTILPLALIISGVLVNLISSYILPVTGGVLLLIFSLVVLRGSKEITKELN